MNEEQKKVLLKIGLRIKSLRILANLTQDELAQKMGYISRSTINKIEKGLVDLTQSKIVEFARVFNVSPIFILGWEEK